MYTIFVNDLSGERLFTSCPDAEYHDSARHELLKDSRVGDHIGIVVNDKYGRYEVVHRTQCLDDVDLLIEVKPVPIV